MTANKKGWLKDLDIVQEAVYELEKDGITIKVGQAEFDYLMRMGLINS